VFGLQRERCDKKRGKLEEQQRNLQAICCHKSHSPRSISYPVHMTFAEAWNAVQSSCFEKPRSLSSMEVATNVPVVLLEHQSIVQRRVVSRVTIWCGIAGLCVVA
jgi:hypothetical protein